MNAATRRQLEKQQRYLENFFPTQIFEFDLLWFMLSFRCINFHNILRFYSFTSAECLNKALPATI